MNKPWVYAGFDDTDAGKRAWVALGGSVGGSIAVGVGESVETPAPPSPPLPPEVRIGDFSIDRQDRNKLVQNARCDFMASGSEGEVVTCVVGPLQSHFKGDRLEIVEHRNALGMPRRNPVCAVSMIHRAANGYEASVFHYTPNGTVEGNDIRLGSLPTLHKGVTLVVQVTFTEAGLWKGLIYGKCA